MKNKSKERMITGHPLGRSGLRGRGQLGATVFGLVVIYGIFIGAQYLRAWLRYETLLKEVSRYTKYDFENMVTPKDEWEIRQELSMFLHNRFFDVPMNDAGQYEFVVEELTPKRIEIRMSVSFDINFLIQQSTWERKLISTTPNEPGYRTGG